MNRAIRIKLDNFIATPSTNEKGKGFIFLSLLKRHILNEFLVDELYMFPYKFT